MPNVLLPASTNEPTPAPDWARNGYATFCRWDGGSLEVAKGFISGWPFLTSPADVEAMLEMYSDRGLRLLQEAGFDWVWLTWSVGFSRASEARHQSRVEDFVAKCAAAGIRTTAYLSLGNMFVDDVARHEPELLECVARNRDGTPFRYPAAVRRDPPARVMACLSHPRWREHLIAGASRALAAGFDALFYDNLFCACMCERCADEYGRFTEDVAGSRLELPDIEQGESDAFEETLARPVDTGGERRLVAAYWARTLSGAAELLTDAARAAKPDALVAFNWHVEHHTFGPPAANALSTEDGQRCGFVGHAHEFHFENGFECDGFTSNAGLLKRMQASSEDRRPLQMQAHLDPDADMESRDFQPYDGATWQRILAESWCFRATQQVFVEGNFATELFSGRESARATWDAIAAYNAYHRRHRDSWAELRSDVAFGVLMADAVPDPGGDWQRCRFLTALALDGTQFDVVLEDRLDAARLHELGTVWCPALDTVGECALEQLESFVRDGGRLAVTGPFASELAVGRARPAGEQAAWIERLRVAGGDRFEHLPDADPASVELPRLVAAAQAAFPVRVTSDRPVLWTSWRGPEDERVLFIFNPDDRSPLEDVSIAVADRDALHWNAPDAASSAALPIDDADGRSWRIPRLEVFGHAVC